MFHYSCLASGSSIGDQVAAALDSWLERKLTGRTSSGSDSGPSSSGNLDQHVAPPAATTYPPTPAGPGLAIGMMSPGLVSGITSSQSLPYAGGTTPTEAPNKAHST